MRKQIATLNAKFEVMSVLKNSKARYAVNIREEDIIELSLLLKDTRGGSSGNYALMFEVKKADGSVATASQNEVTKLFDIFELRQLK